MAKKKIIQSRLPFLLCLLAIATVFYVSKSAFTTLAQMQDRTTKIIVKHTFEKEPIEILSVESDGRNIAFNEPFTADDDWFKGFRMKIKNVSGKTITFISASLIFHETNMSGLPLAYDISYGVPPIIKEPSKDKIKSLASGDIDEMALDLPGFESMKKFLATNKKMGDLTNADFSIQLVYFDDGTKWCAGTFYRPNPAKPGSFIVADDGL